MQGYAHASFIETLHNMLASCKEMLALLTQDKDNFAKNSVSALAENNSKKEDVLTRLNTMTNNLNLLCPAGILNKIESTSDILIRQELTHVLEDLRQTISDCYRNLAVNSKIIFSSTQQINKFWEKLYTFQRNSNSMVYDNKGTIK